MREPGFVFFGGRNQRWLRISKHRVEGDWEVGRGEIEKDWSELDFVLCSAEDSQRLFSNGEVQTEGVDRWFERELEEAPD